MHSPETVAFTIYLGGKRKKNGQYRDPFITIWHNDPEKDGTDDSCGWFMRSRHIDKTIIDKVEKEFEFDWDRTYKNKEGHVYFTGLFTPDGFPNLSVQAIVLNLYVKATKVILNPDGKKDWGKVWKKTWKLINQRYAQIMFFAESLDDSLHSTITRKFAIGTDTPYTSEYRKNMIRELADIITMEIIRSQRKWYQHPKWHIHHWSIQFHPLQRLKRRYWDKCSVCGKRGFKGAAYSDWHGTKIWHEQCNRIMNNPLTPDESYKKGDGLRDQIVNMEEKPIYRPNSVTQEDFNDMDRLHNTNTKGGDDE